MEFDNIHLLIVILLVIILCIEASKYTSNKIDESFSASKTNIIFSNYETEDTKERYALPNEEILVLLQRPGEDRKTLFKYFRGPISQNIAIYTKQERENKEFLLNTVIVKITESNYEILQLLGLNKALLPDLQYNLRYYIKLLDEKTFNYETRKVNELKDRIYRYNLCIQAKMTTEPNKNAAINWCRDQFKV